MLDEIREFDNYVFVKVRARACGLRGAMPRLENLPATIIRNKTSNETRTSWDTKLRGTLEAIDVSENNITGLEELPAASQVRLH